MENKIDPSQPNKNKWTTNFKWFKEVWGFIKFFSVPIGLISAMMVIITSILANFPKIFLTIFIILTLIMLYVSIKFLFLRGKDIPKEAIYRDFRNALLSIGILGGIIFSFILFKPNRDFFADSYLGTRNPTATNTFVPSGTSPITNSLTPLTSTPTYFLSPTLIPYTFTITPSPTLTPILFFQDNFIDNNNGWHFDGLPNLQLEIDNHIFSASANCLSTEKNPTYKCYSFFSLPVTSLKNFYLEMNLTLKDTPDGFIGIRFRDNNHSLYYLLLLYPGTSNYEFLCSDGISEHPIVTKTYSPYIFNGFGQTNVFGLLANETEFELEANGHRLTQIGSNGQPQDYIEDGTVNQKGIISIGLYIPINKRAKFESNYLTITDKK